MLTRKGVESYWKTQLWFLLIFCLEGSVCMQFFVADYPNRACGKTNSFLLSSRREQKTCIMCFTDCRGLDIEGDCKCTSIWVRSYFERYYLKSWPKFFLWILCIFSFMQYPAHKLLTFFPTVLFPKQTNPWRYSQKAFVIISAILLKCFIRLELLITLESFKRRLLL